MQWVGYGICAVLYFGSPVWNLKVVPKIVRCADDPHGLRFLSAALAPTVLLGPLGVWLAFL